MQSVLNLRCVKWRNISKNKVRNTDVTKWRNLLKFEWQIIWISQMLLNPVNRDLKRSERSWTFHHQAYADQVLFNITIYSISTHSANQPSVNIVAAAFVVTSRVTPPGVLLASAPAVQAFPSAVALGKALSTSHALGPGSCPHTHLLLHVHLLRFQEGSQCRGELVPAEQSVQDSSGAAQPGRKPRGSDEAKTWFYILS